MNRRYAKIAIHVGQVALFVLLFGVLSILWDDFWSEASESSPDGPTTDAPPPPPEPSTPTAAEGEH